MDQIPYIVYEGAVVRLERQSKRLVVALVISIVLMFVSNVLWLYAWCQYDYSSEEITYSQDGEGLNNINTGIQGGVTNGPKVDSEETE